MDEDARRNAIAHAEAAVGSTFPDGVRNALITTGEAWFHYPQGVGADPVFRLGKTPEGTTLFADPYGNPITELGGWDSDSTNWHYTERAFIALDNESGDYVLLSPDADGVARIVVLCDAETASLTVIASDIDQILTGPQPLD